MVKELSKEATQKFRANDELRTKVTKAYIRMPGDKRIDRNPYNQLMARKLSIALLNLQQKEAQLIFIVRQQVIWTEFKIGETTVTIWFRHFR